MWGTKQNTDKLLNEGWANFSSPLNHVLGLTSLRYKVQGAVSLLFKKVLLFTLNSGHQSFELWQNSQLIKSFSPPFVIAQNSTESVQQLCTIVTTNGQTLLAVSWFWSPTQTKPVIKTSPMHDPVWASHPHRSLKVPRTEMTENI